LPKSTNAPIVVVPVGDLHVGSAVALCHPDGAALEDGGRYMPNDAQRWLWSKWTELIAIVSAYRAKRYHVIGVQLGEFIDGRHHETTQLLSQAPEIQALAAIDAFQPMATLFDELYVMRGTEAHSGKGAASDYAIAREFGARQDPATGMRAFYKLRLDVDNVLFDIAHHVGGGGDDVRLYGGAIRRETAAMYFEQPRVNVVLRGHVHRYADTGDAFGPRLWGAVIPAWQLKTSFTHRVTRREQFSVGTTLVHVRGEEFSRERLSWDVPPAPILKSMGSTRQRSRKSSTSKSRSR
jgi:hypothetical protein